MNVRTSVSEDVELLIPIIPPEDNIDIMRGWGKSADEVLRDAYMSCAECFSILNGDIVVGMFGVMDNGIIWMMRGRGIDNIALRFVRHGHEFLDRWLIKYGCLRGYISKDYTKFIRWLEWEGFTLKELNYGYLEVSKKCAVQ